MSIRNTEIQHNHNHAPHTHTFTPKLNETPKRAVVSFYYSLSGEAHHFQCNSVFVHVFVHICVCVCVFASVSEDFHFFICFFNFRHSSVGKFVTVVK